MEIVWFLQNVIIKTLFNILLVITFVKGLGQTGEQEPEFLQALDNLTATQGRDVSFTCVVNNLGQYRVAWIKSDSKAILAIHTHMVALNPRLSVTHNGHNTWKLHISHVQLNDSGSYMCQVNTDPMRSQSGHLDVVVPPDILNSPETSVDESVTNEGGNVQLVCQATGVPEPNVQWRREDGKDIVVRNDGRDKQLMKTIEGERLSLSGVQRSDMGGYLCIASNGIPPSVSKRYDVQVNFPPTVKAVNQLVGAPVESNVQLQCIVEAFPKPLNTWYRRDDSTKLYHSEKYLVTESMINSFTWQMNLTVRNLHKGDFESYICGSENALGKADARVRLQELRLPPKPTTTPTPQVRTTVRPTKSKGKSHHQKNHHEGGKHDGKNAGGSGKDIISGFGPNQISIRDGDAVATSEAAPNGLKPNGGDKNSRYNSPSNQIIPTYNTAFSYNRCGRLEVSFLKYFSVLVIISNALVA